MTEAGTESIQDDPRVSSPLFETDFFSFSLGAVSALHLPP